MRRPPCDRTCNSRHVGCHADCVAYLTWKAEWEKVKARKREQHMIDGRHDHLNHYERLREDER